MPPRREAVSFLSLASRSRESRGNAPLVGSLERRFFRGHRSLRLRGFRSSRGGAPPRGEEAGRRRQTGLGARRRPARTNARAALRFAGLRWRGARLASPGSPRPGSHRRAKPGAVASKMFRANGHTGPLPGAWRSVSWPSARRTSCMSVPATRTAVPSRRSWSCASGWLSGRRRKKLSSPAFGSGISAPVDGALWVLAGRAGSAAWSRQPDATRTR
jgi:hypothetical protein